MEKYHEGMNSLVRIRLMELSMPSASVAQPLIPNASVPELPQPYLVFLGDARDISFAKTAHGLRDWAPERCVGELACAGERISIGLPALSPGEAKARGARSLVIGVANMGGVIRDNWMTPLLESLGAGLDIISGMHGRLEDVPALKAAADRFGRRLINVRTPPHNIPVASGRKRTGNRLLTVGTDCALGKKYTALTLAREFAKRGIDADFRATGQTGILIAGSGIPIDAVVADFVAGAAELLSPDASADHWDVVEGQGSIFHPSYGGVSLGLLHGTQPDVIVLCHEAGRHRVLGLEDYATPSLAETMELTLTLARRTNPRVRCAGVALNTARLDPDRARATLEQLAVDLGLPVADPLRAGPELDRLVDACLAEAPA
jgi:uncharacterized NAD-dependent epimerase/dehydratase family protein